MREEILVSRPKRELGGLPSRNPVKLAFIHERRHTLGFRARNLHAKKKDDPVLILVSLEIRKVKNSERAEALRRQLEPRLLSKLPASGLERRLAELELAA